MIKENIQLTCWGCGAEDPKMQCPVCKKLGLPPSFFCTQECFKKNWARHKLEHTKPPPATIDTMNPYQYQNYKFSGPLRPAKITPKRTVPASIRRPDYADDPEGRSESEERERGGGKIPRWKGDDLVAIKRVAKLCREILDCGVKAAGVGVTTDEVDRVVHEATIERGLYPSPLNYYTFPKSCCTSVNEVICHGIPDARPLEEGDILNIDISSYSADGMHGDLNETIFIGKPDEDSARVVHCAYESMMAGFATVDGIAGAMYKHVGDAIEAVADTYGCGVVRAYTGHGIGDKFHTVPNVAHYRNNKSIGVMAPGHVFTIEPMVNLGTWHDQLWPDNWTSTTKDGKRSAQFEHTCVINDDGKPEILTDWEDGIPTYQKQLKEFGMELPKPINPKKE